VTLHPLSQACVFIYSSHGKWVFPLFLWSFLPPPLLQAFLLLVAGRLPPLLPSPAGLFVYHSMRGCPFPLFTLRAPCPLCYMSFSCCCCLFSLFFSFFLGWGSFCPGGYADLAQVVCGSSMSHLAHMVVCVSRAGRKWRLVAREPSWFLHLPWSGDAMGGLGVWRSRSFTSSWWFFLQGVSPASLHDFTLEKHAFCFVPLAAILESYS
jgi:hypothetical protein